MRTEVYMSERDEITSKTGGPRVKEWYVLTRTREDISTGNRNMDEIKNRGRETDQSKAVE